MRTKNIGVRMHGVTLNLRCDHGPLLRHVAELLGDHVCEPWRSPDLEVRGHWLPSGPADDLTLPVFDVSRLDGFGKRMHLGEDELVWTDTHRDKNLQLRFRRTASGPAFDVAYRYLPSTKKLAKYPDFERKKYFDLTRYLVWFPIAWHLKATRGWEMIHASAVAEGDRCVLIAGPGGAGKTTTCIGLVARAGMRLVSENLVFTDGESIFPVPEPIRLTNESLELLGDAAGSLQPFRSPGGLKKKTMFVPRGDANPGVRPALVFLTRFSTTGFARPIPPATAMEWVRATNVLTLELNDYYWYSAALDLLWPGKPQAAESSVQRLVRTTPCISLGIDRSRGVAPVVEQVLACLRGQAQPMELEAT
jgi:hypothetical protein